MLSTMKVIFFHVKEMCIKLFLKFSTLHTSELFEKNRFDTNTLITPHTYCKRICGNIVKPRYEFIQFGIN